MAKTVAEDYAELYHYTTAKGLHGIITSQYLRATNISFLNDAAERIHYFDRRLSAVLERAVRHGFDELVKVPDSLARIEQNGGYEKAVTESLNGLYSKIREITILFDEPYVVSFCGTKDPKIARDGLLSQWRAYGADGGYAIVFDTNELDLLLKEEFEKYLYLTSRYGDVNYYDDENSDAQMPDDFQESEEVLKSSIVSFLKTSNAEELEPVFDQINLLSCLTKHWGFHEEKEVRIVAICGTDTTIEELRNSGETRPVRSVNHYSRSGLLVPFIRLFEGITALPDKKLPIKSIIVGPHPDKEIRKKSVDLLLKQQGISAKVTVSDIPYLPR
jgi:hypothetical protein